MGSGVWHSAGAWREALLNVAGGGFLFGRLRGLFGTAREGVEKLIEFFFVGFDGVGALPFLVGKGGHLRRRLNDVRRQEYQEFSPGVVFDRVSEKLTEPGDVAQPRNFGDGFSLGIFYQPADDDRLAIGCNDYGIGG